MPNWTKDQALAINERGGNIIVSAAAGSGKTAVLSERVIKYVLNGGNIDDLLIVTFTKAAANEMKERIKKKIEDASLNEPLNTHLKDQMPLVSTAKITTMDAFYSDIVKDNFEVLNISRNFEILSGEEEKIIKEDVIKETFKEAFDNIDDISFLFDFLGAKDTNLIKEEVFKVSNFLETLPFKDKFIKEAKENYSSYNNFYKNELFKYIKDKMQSYKEIYISVIDELYNSSDAFDNIILDANKELNYINDILLVNSFDELSSRLRSIVFNTLKTPRGYKDDPNLIKYKYIRSDFKDEIKKNMDELSYITDDIYVRENNKFSKALDMLFEVVSIYQEKLIKKKKSINSYSFSDIAAFTISLLIKDGKKTKLAEEISKSYKEILIDECQDNNNLQNVIFNAISFNDSNLFTVGDVKQSIYRFRSACPYIFSSNKAKATKNSFPKLITLSKNFRSRKEVLDFCNFVFESTMTDTFGEVTYDEDEKLYLGASYCNKENLDTEFYIIDGAEKNENDEDELTRAQKEAVYVADKINEILNSSFTVSSNGVERNVRASDIVILLRSLKNSELYVKALNKRHISVYSSSSSIYFDNYEVKLVINLLKAIDNTRDDISLVSILNSPIFDISLDEIANIRDKKKSVYENILNSNNAKLKEILTDLNYFRELSHKVNIYELLDEIYTKYNIEAIISGMPNGIRRKKNLIQMLNHAVNFEKDELKSLHEFINYIESVVLNKGSFDGVNPLSEGENVLITTIHKSKGLEYPIVFLCETGKNFNFQDVRGNFMINEDLGICFPYRDEKYKVKYESIAMMIFKEYEKNKLLSEELRVLYVALTRAKEKIIITGFVPNLSNKLNKAAAKIGDNELISNLYLKNCKNYLDIMLPSLIRHPSVKNLRDMLNIDVKKFATEAKLKVKIEDAININDYEFKEKEENKKMEFNIDILKQIDNFNYDNSLINVPKLVSVSQIKEDKLYLRRPNFMKDGINHAKTGTLYHKIFEKLPLQKYTINTLIKSLDNMVLNNILTKEEKELIDLDKIFAFLTSDIYDIMLVSDKVLREYEMTFHIPSKYYDNSLNYGKMLTNGIIDLLFINNDTYYIVDYKTDNVSLDELLNRYRIQLELYEIGIKELFNAKNVKKYIYSISYNKFIEV